METKSVIESRRSIRAFRPDPVPDEALKEVLEAARLAPSGGNIQPWRFIVVKSAEARAKLREYTHGFVASAPVVIVCCTDMASMDAQTERYRELREAGAFAGADFGFKASTGHDRIMNERQLQGYLNINTAIAVEHLVLRAADLGLGSCWVMMLKRRELAEWLQMEKNLFPLCLVPIGYADQSPPPRPRKGLEEIVIREI